MKKLFTLLVFLTCFLGAKAVEVVDAEVDFSTMADGSDIKFYGWGASESARARLSIQNGCLHFQSEEATDPSWDCQFHPIGGVAAEVGTVYTLHFKVKGDHAGNVSMLGFGQTPYGQFSITTDWVEGTVDYECTSASGDILMQCGDWVGSWDIAYLKITHEQAKESRPVEWVEQITFNGDAESAWPEWSLEKNDEGININWRGDRTGEICAWALTMGTNAGDTGADGSLDGRARPYPAKIEEDPDQAGNHVFAVHADQIEKIDDDASIQWSNQFWIQAPKGYKSGTAIKLHFRYKAAIACKAATQIHKQHPSDYLHWEGVGDVNFTTEWQEFDKQITFNDSQATGWSLAFNLCADSSVDAPQPANIFYFDDLSWQIMKLDEGYFVAGANPGDGLAYDLYEAQEFKKEGDELIAVVGEEGKADTYVNEVMISTVRGHDGSFKGATLKPGRAVTNDEDDWNDYTEASNAVIKLPGLGVWQIKVDTVYKAMSFAMLEGTPYEKIDIKPNPTEIVINAVEREATASEQPADEAAGIEAGTGQPWDNQFWIVANRPLKKGEVTVLTFKYKAATAAKASTQCHKEPGAYLHWGAIGDVNFTDEWQEFGFDENGKEKTFTVASEADGMESIAFNLAEIKDANVYEIKDVVWKTADEFESLINMEGSNNFFVKIGAGTSPYQYGTDPAGISSVVNKTTGSAAIYNLAGQRVSKDYKGIVVKEGRKYITK